MPHDHQRGVFIPDRPGNSFREIDCLDFANARPQVFRQQRGLVQYAPLRRRKHVASSRREQDSGNQFTAQGAGQPPGGPHHVASCRVAVNQHHHALRRRPDFVDAVLVHVIGQIVIDSCGGLPQGHLAQRREVAGTEEVLQRLLRPLWRIDLSLAQTLDEGVRGQINKLDVGIFEDTIRDRLPDLDPDNPRDDVLQAVEVLDVQGGDDIDPGISQKLHILVALGAGRPGHVRVRQFIYQDDLRLAGEDRIHVHIFEDDAPVRQPRPGDDVEITDLRLGIGSSVGLNKADHNIVAFRLEPAPLVEHGVGLANTRRGAEKDPQRSAPRMLRPTSEVVALQ